MSGHKWNAETASKAGKKSKRKPNLPELSDVRELTARDIKRLVSQYMEKSLGELEELVKDKSLSGLQGVIIRQILVAFQKGDFSGVETMLCRVLGKVPNINHNENRNIEETDRALDKVPREKIVELVKAADDV